MKNINLYNNRAFLPNKLNSFRRNSLAQKMRRDLLRLIIYKPNQQKEILVLKKQIEELIDKNFKSIDELIFYNFHDVFKNFLYPQPEIILNKLNPTNESKELINLFNKINNKSLSIYIHGSHADGYITNYSDMDVSIIIDNIDKNLDFKRISNDILILNNLVKTVDLESHHSIFLYLNNDLNCYPESFMPISVLRNSLTPKNQKIYFRNVRFSIDIAIDSFLRIFSSVNKIALLKNNNNFHNVKFIISSYFMLIILNYEILNMKFLDKKSIFNEFLLEKNNKQFIDIFNICSEIRDKWPIQKGNTDFAISNNIIQKIQQHSMYMLEQIENSLSLKKTLSIILDK